MTRIRERISAILRLEPVAVRTLASALVGVALALGVDLNGDKILEIVDAILPYAGMLLTFITSRGAVTPNAKVAVRTDEIRG